jgi:hypothetical protein
MAYIANHAPHHEALVYSTWAEVGSMMDIRQDPAGGLGEHFEEWDPSCFGGSV